MPYRYLDDIAIADVAFEATGRTREEMFAAAGEALTGVMVEELCSIRAGRALVVDLEAETLERLLFDFLQELIYLKDAEQLLVRVSGITISGGEGSLRLRARAEGDPIDPLRHRLNADVKAVTLHRFEVREIPGGWRATIVLDI